MVPQEPLEMILARQLASHLDVAIALLDGHGEVLFINDAAQLLLVGATDGGERPAWVSELFVGEDGRPSREPFRSVLQNGEAAHARLRTAATAEAVLVTAYPVRGTAVSLAGAMVVFWKETSPSAEAS